LKAKLFWCGLMGFNLLWALPSQGSEELERGRFVTECIIAASDLYHLPAGVLLIILNVENGRLGEVSGNTNDTVDIGPMQINSNWVPQVAEHWGVSQDQAYRALRDEVCANIEGGAWILAQALDDAHGNVWEGVALYHSRKPELKSAYLGIVYRHALRLTGRAKLATRSEGGK